MKTYQEEYFERGANVEETMHSFAFITALTFHAIVRKEIYSSLSKEKSSISVQCTLVEKNRIFYFYKEIFKSVVYNI